MVFVFFSLVSIEKVMVWILEWGFLLFICESIVFVLVVVFGERFCMVVIWMA